MAPPPTFWKPSASHVANCSLTAFVHFLNTHYHARLPIPNQTALHHWTITHPTLFWHALQAFLSFPLHPSPTPHTTLRITHVPSLPSLVNLSWFPHASTNFALPFLNATPRSPHTPALVYCSERPLSSSSYSLSFPQLRSRVLRLAAALRRAGLTKHSPVSAILPNQPFAVVALLAVALIGAVWSSCSPDFGIAALSSRFSQTNPVLLFYTPTYIHNLRPHSIAHIIPKLLPHLPHLRYAIAVPDLADPDTDGDAAPVVHRLDDSLPFLRPGCLHQSLARFEHPFLDNPPPEVPVEDISMSDPVVTMFSSGTTGKPKCIVQGTGILLNQMKEHRLHLDIDHRSTIFFMTSTGWMLHNWLVACLASSATIVLYDGAPLPSRDPMHVVRIAARHRVTHFGSGAAFWRALQLAVDKRNAYHLGKSLSSLNMVLGTGSPSTVEHFQFVSRFFPPDVQYVSMSGGTDINGCFALGSPWLPVRSPELQCAGLGMDVAVFDEQGCRIVGKTGELVCRNSSPCMPLYFAHDDGHHKYRAAYFERFGEHVWRHGDFAEETALGGFIISGRSDATLNPGGIRVGTSDLYAVAEALDFVADTLVTEIRAGGGDVRMVMAVVMKEHSKLDNQAKEKIRSEIRSRVSPRLVPHAIVQVGDVPYTMSGKKCEVGVKKILDGKAAGNTEAVRNPEAFDEIVTAVRRSGLLDSGNGATRACRL